MIEENMMDMCHILGVVSKNNPEKYLGLPAIVGRDKKGAFSDLRDRYSKQIHNWSSTLFSLGVKEVIFLGW